MFADALMIPGGARYSRAVAVNLDAMHYWFVVAQRAQTLHAMQVRR